MSRLGDRCYTPFVVNTEAGCVKDPSAQLAAWEACICTVHANVRYIVMDATCLTMMVDCASGMPLSYIIVALDCTRTPALAYTMTTFLAITILESNKDSENR